MAKEKIIDWRISVTAILCLSVLELSAMYHGINGTMRTIIFMLITGIVGVGLPQPKFMK